MLRPRRVWSLSCSLVLACGGGGSGDDAESTGTASTTESTGDGDPTTGDGDGDPTTGDGDGDPTTGDGDGDPGDGDPMPDPCGACSEYQVCDQDMCITPKMVVYLNFDAEGDFVYDVNSPTHAPSNSQNIHAALSGMLPGYGQGPKRAEITDRIMDDYAPFAPTADRPSPNGMLIVTERPDVDDYSMIVFTPTAPYPTLGIGSLDCENMNLNNIYFAFITADDQYSAQVQGNIGSSGLGISMGLQRVTEPGEVMYQFATDEYDGTFTDGCYALAGTNPCQGFHENWCQLDHQNSYKELRYHLNLD